MGADLKRILITLFLFIVPFLLVSCGGFSTAIYTPPAENHPIDKYSKVINKPFDTVWGDLISYLGKTHFGIENLEKESGLLILSFGSANPEQFVTGGLIHIDRPTGINSFDFKGDYVRYCKYQHNGTLNARMNIVVRRLSDTTTSVRVNARYVFTVDFYTQLPQINKYSHSWIFNTGECSEKLLPEYLRVPGTSETRTICPTYAAEEEILEALGH